MLIIQNFLYYKNSICISFSFRHLRQFGLMTEDPTLWWKAGLGVAAATVLGFVVLKAVHGLTSPSR